MKKSIFSKNRIYLLLIIILAAILRLPLLDKFPPALYSDEVSQGYNAYSVLKTGYDEYGKYLPISFRSFGDWKPPLQTYLMIPTIFIFGLNSYGLRLPGAILGILNILLIYLLIKEIIEIFAKENTFFIKHKINICLATSLFVTISPWHIAQSRSAMLVGITLFFYCLALWLFFKGLKNCKYWIFSSICFCLSIYSYYGMRLIVPLTLIFLGIYFYKYLLIHKILFLISCGLAICILFPLFIGIIYEPNLVLGRAKTISIFYDQGVKLTVMDLQRKDGINFPVKLSQFFHNKPYLYAVDIVRRFFQHLDGRFLFLFGDQNPPFQIPGMGHIYIVDFIFLILGTIVLIKFSKNLFIFIILFIFVSLISSALTFITPASNRSFHLLIPLSFITGTGLVFLISKFSKHTKKLIVTFIIVCYTMNFCYFMYQYIWILPKNHSDWWYFGYKELVNYLNINEKKYENIYLSGRLSVPYIYLLFFNQTDPKQIKNLVIRDYKTDEFGFEHVASVGKYQIPRYFSWKRDSEKMLTNSLLITRYDEQCGDGATKISDIKYPNQKSAFNIYEIK